MLRVREIERNPTNLTSPWFCPKGSTPFNECEKFADLDAYKLGLVTNSATDEIDIPEDQRLQYIFYGRTLNQNVDSLNDEQIDKIALDYCQGGTVCASLAKGELNKWKDREMHRALAIGVGKRGFGWSQRGSNPVSSALRSIYFCNHVKTNPKLCRVVAIDNMLVPDTNIGNNHQKINYAELKIPTQEQVAEEKAEVNSGTAKEMRKGNPTGMAPGEIAGVDRWDLLKLVENLNTDNPPILIDVGAIEESMIPGAIHFFNGGLALENGEAEAAYNERFLNMVRAARGDTERPVVFYSSNSSTWHSANAAIRAQRANLTKIAWFRGGLAFWIKTGLPVSPKMPSAVIY
jgi:hypothetical protein